MRVVVGALAVFHIAEGLWMEFSPDTFFDVVGRYGLENTHYVGDVGAFVLAYGIALIIAVGRPAWRTPLLAVGALWYAFHALNHLLDIDEARSDERGIADTVLLALGAGALAWLRPAADRASTAAEARDELSVFVAGASGAIGRPLVAASGRRGPRGDRDDPARGRGGGDRGRRRRAAWSATSSTSRPCAAWSPKRIPRS